MPVDQDRYEFFKECGEAGLLIAHKKRFPDHMEGGPLQKRPRLKGFACGKVSYLPIGESCQ